MAYSPSCVFRLHQRLLQSERLCDASSEDDAMRFVSSMSSPHRQQLCPFRLAVGDGLTLMSSASEFDPVTTRCHLQLVDAADVQDMWLRAIRFAVRAILGQAKTFGISSLAGHRSCPSIQGVMCMRDSSASFSVALVTQGARSQILKSTVLHNWNAQVVDKHPQPARQQSFDALRSTGSSSSSSSSAAHLLLASDPAADELYQTSSMLFAELPICAAHRSAKLSVWWHSVRDRIVPNAELPPILVQCHLPCAYSTAVFDAVRLFVMRPADGVLRGTLQRSYASPSCLENSHGKQQQQQQPSERASLVDRTNAFMSSLPCRSNSSRLQFVFDDLCISSLGEHLLCAGVTVSSEYLPFVGPLSYSIPPFRVIDPSVG
jgi:hypothetical protein